MMQSLPLASSLGTNGLDIIIGIGNVDIIVSRASSSNTYQQNVKDPLIIVSFIRVAVAYITSDI